MSDLILTERKSATPLSARIVIRKNQNKISEIIEYCFLLICYSYSYNFVIVIS